MVIALAAGLVALSVIVAVLIMKMRHPKLATKQQISMPTKSPQTEIGVDHAPNGNRYVNENEPVDGKVV